MKSVQKYFTKPQVIHPWKTASHRFHALWDPFGLFSDHYLPERISHEAPFPPDEQNPS